MQTSALFFYHLKMMCILTPCVYYSNSQIYKHLLTCNSGVYRKFLQSKNNLHIMLIILFAAFFICLHKIRESLAQSEKCYKHFKPEEDKKQSIEQIRREGHEGDYKLNYVPSIVACKVVMSCFAVVLSLYLLFCTKGAL